MDSLHACTHIAHTIRLERCTASAYHPTSSLCPPPISLSHIQFVLTSRSVLHLVPTSPPLECTPRAEYHSSPCKAVASSLFLQSTQRNDHYYTRESCIYEQGGMMKELQRYGSSHSDKQQRNDDKETTAARSEGRVWPRREGRGGVSYNTHVKNILTRAQRAHCAAASSLIANS
jgi:hypothetical protein